MPLLREEPLEEVSATSGVNSNTASATPALPFAAGTLFAHGGRSVAAARRFQGTPMIRTFAAFAVAAVFSASAEPGVVRVQSVERSSIELHQLFDHYQHAVATKNSKKLLGYFLNDAVPFVGAFAPASYELISSANKQQVPRTFSSNAKEDADNEIKLPPDQIENLSIQTDGEIGTVSWD
jgi:hypothetical protein